jgi:uncharacterized membrane protein YtjA (UPF0391 family)
MVHAVSFATRHSKRCASEAAPAPSGRDVAAFYKAAGPAGNAAPNRLCAGPIDGTSLALSEPEIKGDLIMLNWAITFLVVALVAGLLGFGGIAGAATGIAKILFLVFLIAFVASLVMGRRGSVT